MTSVTNAKENVGFSPQTPLVKSNNAIVKSANVLVLTTKINTIKSTKLFVTAAEKSINEESYQIEIILQIPKIMIQKSGREGHEWTKGNIEYYAHLFKNSQIKSYEAIGECW
jgi:hypothetical protein